MASVNPDQELYPVDEELAKFIAYRKRTGTIWRGLFLASLFVAILVLVVLLLNIINQAFGLVALENEIAPETLTLTYNRNQMLTLPNTLASEDDERLVERVQEFETGIAFFGYSYFHNNQENLKLISIDGVLPTAETVADGRYPLSRSLYLYSSVEQLRENPAVGAYLNYALGDGQDILSEIGYFPEEQLVIDLQFNQLQSWLSDTPLEALEGSVVIDGSSTVYPLARQLLLDFRKAGFTGSVELDSTGTAQGLQDLCAGSVQIATASRRLTNQEKTECDKAGLHLVEIRVGRDAVALVANQSNSFLTDLSGPELVRAFTQNNFWDEVNPAYPSSEIVRLIPGDGSGTLDFFSKKLLSNSSLSDLPSSAYTTILADNMGRGRGRALEREQRFLAAGFLFDSEEAFTAACGSDEPPAGCTAPVRSNNELYNLIVAEIVVPQVQNTWSLYDSIFNRRAAEQLMVTKYPNATLEFKSWLNSDFLTNPQSSEAELAGVRTAIRGTLLVVLTTFLFSFPIGVGAAVYMEEYADQTLWFNKIIQTNISNLAGVPSIIYGMLGLTVFVRILLPLTSGQWFGRVAEGTDPSGRTVISAGLTLGLLILPIIIINAQEAIRAVPGSIRRAGMGLGATKWQTTWAHVLPQALPGILTGTILAMSRAVGETAPLIVVGASTVIRTDPTFFSRFTVLPIQIYQWTSRPQAEFQNIAAAAIIVLLVILLTLNASAVILRNRFSISDK